MNSADVSLRTLASAIQAADSPHVDIAPMIGVNGELKLGLEDLHTLVASGEPTLKLEWQSGTVTVKRADGGVMATLEVHW